MKAVTQLLVATVLSLFGLCASQQNCYSCVVTMYPETANRSSSLTIGGVVYNGASVMQSGGSLTSCPVYPCTAVYDSCQAQQISTSPRVIMYSCQIFMRCLNTQQYGSGSRSTVNCCLGQSCNTPLSSIPQDRPYSSATGVMSATCLIFLNAVLVKLFS